jgi:hypothetical protein
VLLEPAPSLAEAPAHRAAATCLGEPVAAMLLASDRVTGTNGAAVLAVGVMARGEDVVNVICVVGDAAGAAAREAALRAASDPETLDPPPNPRGGGPGLRAARSTTQDGDLTVARAELVLQPDVPAGYIVQRVIGTGESVLLGAGFDARAGSSSEEPSSTAP